jgi:hypothetical protein
MEPLPLSKPEPEPSWVTFSKQDPEDPESFVIISRDAGRRWALHIYSRATAIYGAKKVGFVAPYEVLSDKSDEAFVDESSRPSSAIFGALSPLSNPPSRSSCRAPVTSRTC